MVETKQIKWKDIKSKIEKEDKSELLKLISTLYSLNKENKMFLNTKFYAEEISLKPFKKEIQIFINPTPTSNSRIKIVEAKKVISNYYKATKDNIGKLELMVYFYEEGIDSLSSYDGSESYYDAITNMFDKILKILEVQSVTIINKYLIRIKNTFDVLDHLGYGTGDYILGELEDFENKNN
jgi:hypothetical protein